MIPFLLFQLSSGVSAAVEAPDGQMFFVVADDRRVIVDADDRAVTVMADDRASVIPQRPTP